MTHRIPTKPSRRDRNIVIAIIVACLLVSGWLVKHML